MPKITPRSKLLEILKEANDVFKSCAKKSKVLAALSWNPEVTAEFFQKKEAVLPKPIYSVNIDEIKSLLGSLNQLEPKIQGEHPLLIWLRRKIGRAHV